MYRHDCKMPARGMSDLLDQRKKSTTRYSTLSNCEVFLGQNLLGCLFKFWITSDGLPGINEDE